MSSVARVPRVAVVGDRNPRVAAHLAIPQALEHAGRSLGRQVAHEWVPTPALESSAGALAGFDGVWCTPGSPYASMDGALRAIRHARETAIPFLGTCGGFQHALIEFARNVLGIADAEHAETSPGAAALVITPLACSLAGTTGQIRFAPGSRLAKAYGCLETTERFQCSYGLNPEYLALLSRSALRPTGWDEQGSLRTVELEGHPFFVGTLFQPELQSTADRPAPVVRAFVEAVAG